MIDEIISYLKNLKFNYRLYVTITKNNLDNNIIQKLKNFKNDVNIIEVKNKGVDVGAFLETLKQIDKSTDLILKIHTKKGIGSIENPSLSVKRKGIENTIKQANAWFHNLMRGVLKNENQVLKILDSFEKNKKIGMVGFRLYNSIGLNKFEIIKLMDKIKIEKKFVGHNFIGGTMFWVRYSILEKYLTTEIIDFLLNQMKDGYVIEPSTQHALERIFGYMIYQENQEIVVID
jgi:lipopolysaccharide biosynthesis protein